MGFHAACGRFKLQVAHLFPFEIPNSKVWLSLKCGGPDFV